jgi:hypothetical protein
MALLALALALVALLVARALFCLPRRLFSRNSHKRAKRTAPCKAMIVIGSGFTPVTVSYSHLMSRAGGHTSEMLRLMSGLEDSRYHPRLYVMSNTDKISESKVTSFEQSRAQGRSNTASDYSIIRIPRSREVRQSWASTVLTSIWALFRSLPLPFMHLPDVVCAPCSQRSMS